MDTQITCECGFTTTKYGIKNHMKSKRHETYVWITNEHADKIRDNQMVYCDVCNKEVQFLSYRKHLESKDHIMKVNGEIEDKTKIKCECGITIMQKNYEEHLKATYHKERLEPFLYYDNKRLYYMLKLKLN